MALFEIAKQFVGALHLSRIAKGASAYEQLLIREGRQLKTACFEPA